MWRYNYNNELYHFGVPGMKWGRRRYQNKNGKLTSSGQKRYSDSEQPKQNIVQRHKSNLVNKYKDKGYNDYSAEMAAKQRMQTEAVLGVIGAVAVTAIAIKVGTRVGQNYFDKTYKSGKTIQNIGSNGKTTFKNEPFFAAVNKHDKKTYGALYPNEKRRLSEGQIGFDGIYKNKISITKDAKRASVHTARKTFYEKMDKDPAFKKEVLETLPKTKYKRGVADYSNTGKKSKKLYDSFNQALATPEVQKSGLHKQFYSELKKKGYDAILDINDTRYSGYKTVSKSPTIFFNGDKLEKIGSQKLSNTEITENALNWGKNYIIKNNAKQISEYAAAGVAIKKINNQRTIEKYLNKHPNTKLSKKEILERSKYGLD